MALFQMEERIRSIESELSEAEESRRIKGEGGVVLVTTDPQTPLASGAEEEKISQIKLSALDEQERKIRIAFLQNRQAELETEILLLRNSQLSPGEDRVIDDCELVPKNCKEIKAFFALGAIKYCRRNSSAYRGQGPS